MVGCGILGWPAMLPDTGAVIVGAIGCVGGATVGAISGGIYGAIAAEPEASVQTILTTVRTTLTGSEIQQRVLSQVRELMAARTQVPLATSDESVVSTRLETEILSIQLDGLPPSLYAAGSAGRINPDLRLVVTAQARLMRMPNKEDLYVAQFQYWGATMTVSEWASHGAQLVPFWFWRKNRGYHLFPLSSVRARKEYEKYEGVDGR